MSILASVIRLANMLFNAFGRFCLAPVAVLPGWLSLSLISAITGFFFLIVFKYTSNQKAIGRVKDDMKAQMLAIKLFKDSISVTLTAQCRLFKGALLLLVHAIVPMIVMILPMSLLLAQMALWYQYRPLLPQESIFYYSHNSRGTCCFIRLQGENFRAVRETPESSCRESYCGN